MSFDGSLRAAHATLESLRAHEATLVAIADAVVDALRGGGKLLTCGNGGSASEAQHLVTELIGRYAASRRPLPAVFLGGDASQLSCIANDFSFDDVFVRPLAALGGPGDVLLCFSTSGGAENLVRTLALARSRGIPSASFLGKRGGRTAGASTWEVIVDSNDTARIQEAHLFLLHWLCDRVEQAFPPDTAAAAL